MRARANESPDTGRRQTDRLTFVRRRNGKSRQKFALPFPAVFTRETIRLPPNAKKPIVSSAFHFFTGRNKFFLLILLTRIVRCQSYFINLRFMFHAKVKETTIHHPWYLYDNLHFIHLQVTKRASTRLRDTHKVMSE